MHKKRAKSVQFFLVKNNIMATKFYLDRRSPKKDGTFPLKLRISKGHDNAMLNLGINLKETQWDEVACRITGLPNRNALNTYVATRKVEIDSIILALAEKGKYASMSAKQIKEYIVYSLNPDKGKTGNFLPEFEKCISLKVKPRTREIYEATLSKIKAFDARIDLLDFEDITKEWLLKFDAYMAKTSPSKNARNIHLRNIRSVFNEAIDEDITSFYPFRKFKIKEQETPKRSLTVEQLRELFAYPVDDFMQKYVDMFKLIFCLIGINTADLLALTPRNVKEGRVMYNRAKTGRLYDIKLEPEASEIIEKYKGKSHLLMFLDNFTDYRDFARRINKHLKRIGETKIGKQGKKTINPIFPQISTYWARHSWATIAASLDIPKETIAAALGHGGNSVTDIYIKFDQRKVDEANRRVLDWVLYGKK